MEGILIMSMFRNLLVGGKKEYEEIEYLNATGDQYIEVTNLIPNNHKLELKFRTLNYNSDNHIFGANYTGSYSDGARYWSLTTYNNRYYWGYNGSEGNGGSWNSNIRTFIYNDFNNHEVKLDGTTLASGKNISTQGYLTWFRRHHTSSYYAYSNKFIGYFYYAKIWDRSTQQLVAEFIPVRRIADNICGMYETVTKTFYRSSSGTDFPSS